MGRVRIITLILGVIFLIGTAPYFLYSDYKREVKTEKILFKQEAFSSEKGRYYYFILEDKGELEISSKTYYKHEVGQRFSYYSNPSLNEKFSDFYITCLLIFCILFLLAMFICIMI